MKTGRGFCLLILTVNTLALFTSLIPTRAISASSLKDLSILKSSGLANDLPAPARNLYDNPKAVNTPPSLSNAKSPESITTMSLQQPAQNQVKETEEYCAHPGNRRRSLVLIRRGCFGKLGSGLLSAADLLAAKGNGLKRFDQLTTGQKIKWLGRKTKNGAKNVASIAVKTVVVPAKALAFVGEQTFKAGMAVLRGTGWAITKTGELVGTGLLVSGYLAYKGGSATLKLLSQVALRLWKYVGKGLAATGRGLQRTGDGMQAQTAGRLAKKVKPPPSEAPAPQAKTGFDTKYR